MELQGVAKGSKLEGAWERDEEVENQSLGRSPPWSTVALGTISYHIHKYSSYFIRYCDYQIINNKNNKYKFMGVFHFRHKAIFKNKGKGTTIGIPYSTACHNKKSGLWWRSAIYIWNVSKKTTLQILGGYVGCAL